MYKAFFSCEICVTYFKFCTLNRLSGFAIYKDYDTVLKINLAILETNSTIF